MSLCVASPVRVPKPCLRQRSSSVRTRAFSTRKKSSSHRVSSAMSPKVIQYPADLSDPVKRFLKDSLLLSWLAYSDPSTVNKSFIASRQCGAELKDADEVLKWVDETPLFITSPECDAQCYLVKYRPPEILDISAKPVLAICARGTTSLMDWICDAQVGQVSLRDSTDTVVPGVEVHRGFYAQFIALFSKMDKIVKLHLRSGGNVLCTGHSLGSSSSCIAALNYARQYPTQVYYAGCGTPRVGNRAFADEFDRCVQYKYRLKNERDPVVSIVPPLDYVHVGQEIHLGAADPIPAVPIMTDVSHHYVSNYVKSINSVSPTPVTRTQSWYQKLLSDYKL